MSLGKQLIKSLKEVNSGKWSRITIPCSKEYSEYVAAYLMSDNQVVELLSDLLQQHLDNRRKINYTIVITNIEK